MKFKELVEHSVAVYDGMVVYYPHWGKEDRITSVSEIVSKFNGRFAVNNSTIAFVFDQSLYATPYTTEAITTLEESCYRREYFYAPFSNGDYPKLEQEKWKQLRREAKEAQRNKYAAECSAWCAEHNIGTIANIERCFRMPFGGMEVRFPQGYLSIQVPLCSSMLDSSTLNYLGKYSVNNGVVSFVYCDGGTYLAKGYKIIGELEAAGYTEAKFNVHLSNNEKPTDAELRAKWESIPRN